MIVKKSVLCKECKSYVNYYIEEHSKINKISLKCKCGCNQEIQLKNKIR